MRRLDDVVIFTRIVEEKSISRAAQLLHMSPSAVSRRLTRLEADLKIRLFNRSTHHLSLTEGGNIFYDHCVKALTEIERGITSAEETVVRIGGTIRIHASQGVGQSLVAPAIIEFVKQYSATSVELEINDKPINLLERKFDVSIRGKNFTDEGLDDVSSLSCVELLKAPYAICASPDYLARSTPLREPSDLKMHNCLIHTTQLMPYEWWFTERKKDYKVKVHGNFVTNNGRAIYDAALNGLGVARVAQYRIADDVRQKRLRAFFPDITKSDRSVRAYYPRMLNPPAKLRTFLRFLNKKLSLPD